MALENKIKKRLYEMSNDEFDQLLEEAKPFNDMEIPWTEEKQVNVVETALDKAKNLTNNTTEQYWYQEGYYDGVKNTTEKDIEKALSWWTNFCNEHGILIYDKDRRAFQKEMNT